MYSYINGVVKDINSNYLIVETANIGYEILCANPYRFRLEEESKIFLYQHVKEDELTLYGFKNKIEKKLFLDLISVKGIGPKTGLAILAVDESIQIADAIEKEDINFLTKFPKIGKKAAMQMIVDLKGKIEINETISDVNNLNSNFSINDDIEAALQSLGYSKGDIKKAISSLVGDYTVEEGIKKSLQLMLQK